MPNQFSYFILAIWPIIGIAITRKKEPDVAVVLLFLVPYLILPPLILLPITSSLDKYTVPSMAALLIMRCKYGPMKLRPNSRTIKILILMLIISPVLTYFFNRDSVFLPHRIIPGLAINDIVNTEFHNFCWKYVPILLGFAWLSDPKSHTKLLGIISVSGLIYSIPMLWEVRMSPQLNSRIYGFFPGGFDQSIRAGGFRPVVFLEHGLRVAVFFFMSITAATAIYRENSDTGEKKNTERKWRFISLYKSIKSVMAIYKKNTGLNKSAGSHLGLKLFYMVIVMLLCKTWSALIYTAIAQALIFFTKPRVWIRFSVIVLTLVFVFPYVRSAGWIPTQQLSNFFSQYSSERSDSLQYRFDNEDLLLHRANARPLTGWGGWGRNRVYNSLGQDVSVTDGEWIILYGTAGWIGYIAGFGLILFPALLVSRKISSKQDMEIPISTAGIFIILAFNMLDLIPNSSITPITYLLSGALLGYANWVGHDCRITDRGAKPSTRRQRAAVIRHGGFSRS